jgi:hypothetical protein
MAADVYTFQGTNGATISGTGHTLVGSGGATYDNTWAVGTSSTSGKFVANAGLTRADRLAVTSPSVTCYIDEIVEIPTLPAISSGVRYILLAARSGASATSGAVACSVQVTELGQLALISSGNIDTFSATGFVAGDKVRVSLGLVVATTSTGQVVAKTYTSASNFTTQSGSTFTSSARNLGTAAISWVEVGSGSAATPGVTTRVGLLQVEAGRTTEFSAPPSAGATTAALTVASGSQYPEVGDSVGLTAAASTGSGTLTYSCVCTSRSPGAPLPQINNATTSTPTVVIPTSDFAAVPPVLAGAQYTFTETVTGSGGADTETITLYAHEHAGDRTGIHAVTLGSWTNEGGATDAVAALNDSSSTTRTESPNPATAALKMLGTFRPLKASTDAPVWTVPSNYSGSATDLTLKIYLEDGVTLVDEHTWTLGSTEAANTFTTDSGGQIILGSDNEDWRALKFELYGS